MTAEEAMKAPDLPKLKRPRGWAPAHDKEMKFNADKKRDRLFEARRQGCLLPDEEAEGDDAAFAEQNAKRLRQDQAAARQKDRNLKRAAPAKLLLADLKHSKKKVYLDADCADRQGDMPRLGLCLVHEASLCGVIVARSCLSTSWSHVARWAAYLVGAYVVTPSFLDGGSGPVAKFQAATSFWRRVHVTMSFGSRHPRVAALLRDCSRRPGSKWMIVSKQALADAYAKAVRSNKGSQVVVLGTGQEVVGPMRGIPRGCKCLSFFDFERSICKPDEARTVSR